MALVGGNAIAEPGFAGKTVTILVGTSPGGGYDAYARMLARYLPKHLPGSTVVVKNMTGGGGTRLANYIYAAAPADGTEFASPNTACISHPSSMARRCSS